MENKNSLHEHFEKLYFFEVESREKLNGRLQLPLAIITAILGVMGYIIQNTQFDKISDWDFPFAVLFTTSATLLGFAIVHFIKSWYNNLYSFLPTPRASLDYKTTLESTYADYENCNELVEKYMNEYIFKAYAEYTSQNAECNDRRSINLNKTHEFLIYASLALLFSFVIFFVSSIDKKIPSTLPTPTIIPNHWRKDADKRRTTKSKQSRGPRTVQKCTCCCACKATPATTTPPPAAPSDKGRR